jgi:hypothetical protein
MIGCADVIRGYPTPDKAVIGLLLLAESWQQHGFGRAFARWSSRRLPIDAITRFASASRWPIRARSAFGNGWATSKPAK